MNAASLGFRCFVIYPVLLTLALLCVARSAVWTRVAIASSAAAAFIVETILSPNAMATRARISFSALLVIPFVAVAVCLYVFRDPLNRKPALLLLAVPTSYMLGVSIALTAAMATGAVRP